MSDDVTSTHPQLIDPQGKCVTSWSVVLYASITISQPAPPPPPFRSPQCGQALEDGERGYLGRETKVV